MSADRCTLCGQLLPNHSGKHDAAWLLDILTNGTPNREVYRAGDGSGWYVTYGGGWVAADAVLQLVKGGWIHSVYSDCPNDSYHMGRTIDVARTMAERKKHRRAKDAPKIYVGDPLTESASANINHGQ